jgi:hypothetical protein
MPQHQRRFAGKECLVPYVNSGNAERENLLTGAVRRSDGFDLALCLFTSPLELLLSSVAYGYICRFDASAVLINPSLGLKTASGDSLLSVNPRNTEAWVEEIYPRGTNL